MTYTHAKVQHQRSVGSKDKVERNGQMDGYDCITSLTDVVIKKYAFFQNKYFCQKVLV